MGEFEIIRRIVSRSGELADDVVVGPGDDCAVVRHGDGSLLLTDDALVEDVHFRSGFIGMHELGARAAAVAMSDVAAMGGTARWLLASVVAPASLSEDLPRMAEGMTARASTENAVVVGGNLSRGPRLVIAISVVGVVDGAIMLRSGARPGDLLAVTGELGGAAAGLRLLLDERSTTGHESLVQRWRSPPERLPTGRALASFATAAIDVSDGLLQDLGHIVRASGVGASVQVADIPLAPGYGEAVEGPDSMGPALSGGEDYELLVAVPPSRIDRAARAVEATGTTLTVIGSFTEPGGEVVLVNGDGSVSTGGHRGWDHFGGG